MSHCATIRQLGKNGGEPPGASSRVSKCAASIDAWVGGAVQREPRDRAERVALGGVTSGSSTKVVSGKNNRGQSCPLIQPLRLQTPPARLIGLVPIPLPVGVFTREASGCLFG
jgi:hypothetical protein